MPTASDDVFERLYHAIITAAIYASVWCACLYWPPFIAYALAPDMLLQTEMVAIFILLPLGLTALGVRSSFKRAGVHLMFAIIAVVGSTAYLLATGRDSDNEFIRVLVLSSLAIAYVLAAFLAYRKQLRS